MDSYVTVFQGLSSYTNEITKLLIKKKKKKSDSKGTRSIILPKPTFWSNT